MHKLALKLRFTTAQKPHFAPFQNAPKTHQFEPKISSSTIFNYFFVASESLFKDIFKATLASSQQPKSNEERPVVSRLGELRTAAQARAVW